VPEALNPNVTGWLMYDDKAAKPSATALDAFTPFDDYTLAPQDGLEIYSNVDYSFNLDLKMDNLGDGAN
jgi:iron transport multicopper oxidase